MSSLGLKGSLSCPNDTVHESWPPPPPPLPKPCAQGPDPRRGCPHYDWFWTNTAVSLLLISICRVMSYDGAPQD